MAARANWKGQLKLSLVSFPIRLHTVVSGASRVSFNQLHKDCHRRLKQQMVCPEHGPVDRGDIVKGYEFEKDKYVVIDDADIEKVKIESSRTIDLMKFVNASDVDPLYFDTPYYVAPDGPVADEAFRVIREAMRGAGKVGIGRVVMGGREHVMCLSVVDKGFVLMTLRSAEEVRGAAPYFADIKDGPISDEQLKLAQMLIESKAGEFDAADFTDRYQVALLDMVKAKIEGAEPVVTQEEEVGKVINLMDALRQSVESLPPVEKMPPARSVKSTKPKSAKTTKKRA